MQFVKRNQPVVEAERFDVSKLEWFRKYGVYEYEEYAKCYMVITKLGPKVIRDGDWIISDSYGLEVMMPAMFEAAYKEFKDK